MTVVETLLHRLWTKAVGTPDYDKAEWKQLRVHIEGLTNLACDHDGRGLVAIREYGAEMLELA